MPLYDFRCRRCGASFEALVSLRSSPPCPACGDAAPERLFSPISRPLKFGLRGADARRSNGRRRAREERRREQRAKRQERNSSG